MSAAADIQPLYDHRGRPVSTRAPESSSLADDHRSMVGDLIDAVDAEQTLEDLFDKHGVNDALPADTKTLPGDEATVYNVAFGDLLDADGDQVVHNKTRRQTGRVREVRNEEMSVVGSPGTPIDDTGEIIQEPNPRYRPWKVRGELGDPGKYEEFYRTDAILFDSIGSNTEPMVTASWDVTTPTRLPEGREDEVREWVEWAKARLFSIRSGEGGWRTMIEQMSLGVQKFGFSPHEVVWSEHKDRGDGDPRKFWPSRIEWRAPWSVDGWVLDDRMSRLLAAKFDTGPEAGSMRYVLTNRGENLTDYKLCNPALYVEGNNFEGISPMRPSLFLIKLKRLILQIIGVGVEKHGVPMTVISEDPSELAEMARQVSDEQIDDLYDTLSRLRAIDASVFQEPAGVSVDVRSADGRFPSMVMDVLDYIDQMIARPYSNEGSLLGLQQTHGSYALGAVKESSDLRSVFFYARNISQAINRILRVWAEYALGELPAYPELEMRLDGFTDGSAWVQDAGSLFAGADVRDWPEEARRAAAQKMNLSEDAFDEADEDDEEGAADTAGAAEDVGNTVQNQEPGPDPDKTNKRIDQLEKRLGRRLREVGRDLRDTFRDRESDLIEERHDPDEFRRRVEGIEAQYRDEWLDQFREAAEEVMGEVTREGVKSQLREFGPVPRDSDIDLDGTTQGHTEMNADRVAREAFNRQFGLIMDRMREFQSGESQVSIPVLAESTYSSEVAGRYVPTVFNRGRTQVIEQMQAEAELQEMDGEAIAMRSSVLDSSTCARCEKLHGTRVIVGSDNYYDIQPPNKCEGKHRCRCIYVLIESDDPEFENLKDEIRQNGGVLSG